ncbi:unnamed protein product [Symbiodinium microadriaticum]|nr:unnamed protein product [Symbiodinium microadriaticum]
MFDETYQSEYEYAEVSWAGGLRKGQLDEFAQAVHRLSPYYWKAASESNGFIAGNNTLVGYGLEYKSEFKAYPVKDGPRTVVVRRRLQTPLILQCFPRVHRDALTVDFYTLGGRNLGRPMTFRCEEVGFHKLEQKARKRALRVELLKSPLQPIRLLVQGWSSDDTWIGHTFGTTTHALKIRPARDVLAPAVIGRLTAGCKISLMETGTKLIKGTAILAESRCLTVEEQITFANVLQALNYETKQTYAWVLRDVHVHPEPFEAQVKPPVETHRAMAAHFEPGLYRKVKVKFMDEARRVAVDFGVTQPLNLAELRPDTAHGIRQLSRHMQLSEPDGDWLLRLASHLEAELGEVLVPALWQLKDNAVTSTMRRERPRQPSPFSLPPAATDRTDADASAPTAGERKKRPRAADP